MKRFKSYLTAALALIASLPLSLVAPAPAAHAQTTFVFRPPFTLSTAETVSAVNTAPAIFVRYVGTAAGAATIAVAASGDITVVANGAADTTVNPTPSSPCGATPGTLDLSTPASTCDTLGEVVDVFNASPNWVAVTHAALRSDTSDNALFTLSTTSAKAPEGLTLFHETGANFVTVAPLPRDGKGTPPDIRSYTAGGNGKSLSTNPFEDGDSVLAYAHENITATSPTTFLVYCVVPSYNKGKTSSEQAYLLYQEAAAASTTTGLIDEFRNAGGLVCNGGKIVVRVNASGAITAPTVFATGYRQLPRR